MGTVKDVIGFLRDVGVIKGNTVDYSGIIHYTESISLILGLSPEESVKKSLVTLLRTGMLWWDDGSETFRYGGRR
jgi:hypothetical protein